MTLPGAGSSAVFTTADPVPGRQVRRGAQADAQAVDRRPFHERRPGRRDLTPARSACRRPARPRARPSAARRAGCVVAQGSIGPASIASRGRAPVSSRLDRLEHLEGGAALDPLGREHGAEGRRAEAGRPQRFQRRGCDSAPAGSGTRSARRAPGSSKGRKHRPPDPAPARPAAAGRVRRRGGRRGRPRSASRPRRLADLDDLAPARQAHHPRGRVLERLQIGDPRAALARPPAPAPPASGPRGPSPPATRRRPIWAAIKLDAVEGRGLHDQRIARPAERAERDGDRLLGAGGDDQARSSALSKLAVRRSQSAPARRSAGSRRPARSRAARPDRRRRASAAIALRSAAAAGATARRCG